MPDLQPLVKWLRSVWGWIFALITGATLVLGAVSSIRGNLDLVVPILAALVWILLAVVFAFVLLGTRPGKIEPIRIRPVASPPLRIAAGAGLAVLALAAAGYGWSLLPPQQSSQALVTTPPAGQTAISSPSTTATGAQPAAHPTDTAESTQNPPGVSPAVTITPSPASTRTATPTSPPQTPMAGSWARLSGLPRYINTFAVDPANPLVVYAGTGMNGSGSGVYKSQDGGLTWQLKAAGLPSEDVEALAFSGSAPASLYAGVGDNGKIFRSTDGATTWAQVGRSLSGGSRLQLFPVPGSDSLFALRAGEEFAVSSNAGQSWTPVKNGLPADENWTHLQTLAINPTNPAIMYAGTGGFVGNGHGVYKSSDGGASWVATNAGMVDYRIQALAVDPQQPDTIYAGADSGEVWKSTDGGAVWTEITGNLRDFRQDLSVRSIYIDPHSSETVYLLYDPPALAVSHDAGARWSSLGRPDVGSWVSTANIVLFGTPPVFLLGTERDAGWRLQP